MTTSSVDPFTLTLFTALSGTLSARLDHQDGTSLHLHSLVAPEDEAHWFEGVQIWGSRIILAGCGLGYHLNVESLQSIGADAGILLCEYYPELVKWFMERLPEELRKRITIITRETDRPWEVAKSFVAKGGPVQIVRHPPSFVSHEKFYRSVLQACSCRNSRSRPIHRAVMLQGSFFMERQMAVAARNRGLTTITIPYKQLESAVTYESYLQRALDGGADMILSINMLGMDGNGILLDYAKRAGVPVVVWFLDDPRPILLNRGSISLSGVIACSWERSYLPWLRQQGFDSVHYLPLATGFSPEAVDKKALNKDSIRCGFVGTSMGGRFLYDITRKFLWKPQYETVAARVAEKIMVDPAINIDRLIDNACSVENLHVAPDDCHTRTWLRSYTIHTASMLKRKACIGSLLDSGVETFGDPEGWRAVGFKGLVTHPDVDYQTGIAACYHSIMVNLNITSCQMVTAVNQRVFDAPACGAFIINDSQKDLDELFAPNEQALYHSPEELPGLVDYYSRNESARNSIVEACAAHIMKEHTCNHRLNAIEGFL